MARYEPSLTNQNTSFCTIIVKSLMHIYIFSLLFPIWGGWNAPIRVYYLGYLTFRADTYESAVLVWSKMVIEAVGGGPEATDLANAGLK